MSGWDDSPAEPSGSGEWQADADGDGANFDGISPENTSKHADGTHGGDGGCRICGDEGHFARDCPNKTDGGNSGECYNCGQMGHNKADCTNERVQREFTGECRVCAQTGHRAADCPEKPPSVCKLCKEEGHIATECSVNRIFTAFAGMQVEDLSAEDAWKKLEAADKEQDVDDIKRAIVTYAKAYPDVTFEELEQVFRDAEMNTYLIAKVQEISDTHTIVNLQGKIDQEYVVSVQFSAKPRRAKFAEGWPQTPEENMTRLAASGLPMDRMVPKCINCGQLGHLSKQCTEEKVEKEKHVITCANCNEEGHRARDCTQARKSNKRGCRNCGDEGHISKECPEPPNLDNVECKNCNQMGHFSRDCPDRAPEMCRNCGQEGHRAKDCTNERVMQCRNCDEYGHASRECPKPRDYSRVECKNCHEKGHTVVRCPKPVVAQENGEGDGEWDGGAGDSAAAAEGDGGSWGGSETAAASSGGW